MLIPIKTNDKNKKEVVTIGRFGFCPRCGKPMRYLSYYAVMYGLNEYGILNSIKGEKFKDTLICPNCFYYCEAKLIDTSKIVPMKYYENITSHRNYEALKYEFPEDDSIYPLENPVGYVENS